MKTREELMNKYIRWDKSITSDIFNNIIKTLDNLFVRAADRDHIIPNNFKYETFKSTHTFLWIMPWREDKMSFSLDNHKGHATTDQLNWWDIWSPHVHDKCCIGDVIVSVEKGGLRKIGDLHVVLPNSTEHSLYYQGPYAISESNKECYRLASKEEADAYRRGIKNIKDIPKESIPQYVEAQPSMLEEAKKRYPVGTKFIDLVHGVKFCVKSHLFDTFGNANQLYVPVEPKKGYSNKTARIYLNGKWAEIVETPKKEESMEDILEEAKRRFPVGCKFRPVQFDGGISSQVYTQERECYIYSENWIIGSMNIRNPDGVWAELVETPLSNKLKLLMEAKKRYPPGTVYRGLVRDTSTPEIYTAPPSNPYFYSEDSIALADGYGLVYIAGVWAPVMGNAKIEDSLDEWRIAAAFPDRYITAVDPSIWDDPSIKPPPEIHKIVELITFDEENVIFDRIVSIKSTDIELIN